MRYFDLNDNQKIPALGFGTWQLTGRVCEEATSIALETGYRHIDTAKIYGNQLEIGRVLQNYNLPREELFITSKVWISDYKKEDAFAACKRTLEELGLEYLDLYLMHWPMRSIPLDPLLEAFVQLKEEGLIKEWGVSNCTIHHLQDIIDRGYNITNNQIEFHPSLNQKQLKDFCDEKDILITAYSPIAQGDDLKLGLIQDISLKYMKSEAQVILNWLISKGMVAIPRSSSRLNIEDNFGALTFELDDDDIESIDELDFNNRIVTPDFADFGY